MDIVEFIKQKDQVGINLGIEIVKAEFGDVITQMTVRKDMLNAADVCHGGIIFSLADYTFALISNIYGNLALSVSANINFVSSAKEGDVLIAYAKELSRAKNIGLYEIRIKRKIDERLIAFFSGEAFIKSVKITKN